MLRLETERIKIKSVLIKIKTFLHRRRWEEVLIFFSFLLLSFGFWILQSLNEEYETEIRIPVRYEQIPAEIAFAQNPPKEIVVSIKDKGNVLLNYSFGKNFSPVIVDYKKDKDKKDELLVSQAEIESHIQKELFNTTQINSFTPTQIKVKTSKRKQKKVPIRFNGSVLPSNGYGIADKIAISPKRMNIYSSQNILDSISEIKTIYVNIINAKKNITKTVSLEEMPGVVFDQPNVSLSIPIEEFTEKTLNIPIVCTGIPHNYIVRTFPPLIKVNCNVPLSKYKKLNEDSFSIRIKFENLEQQISGLLPVELEKKPDWIQNYTLVPDKIEFIIEQATPIND
ncbi:MAG: CdaR family protein [Massilibacteroides sp.]|nr:CdaR family protein [Massilibacteroides sp.]MDD3062724.1 CdaR family protein [Massilibacteroides sp.]MDD4114154.1 CdaR family protein [Massilibacteroides sp.]MDD4660487.1 CdaR family protein [Massilibacteroides sp.]